MSLDSLDYGADDDLDTSPLGPLNEEDVLWGVECAISHVANDYVRRIVRAAEDDASAAQAAKQECRWWGRSGGGESVEGESKGIRVRRDGREGIVPWLVLAQRCRGTYNPPRPQDEQITLF